MESLRDRARDAGLTPEQLVQQGIAEWTHRKPQDAFDAAVDYVLEKNRELYRRLA